MRMALRVAQRRRQEGEGCWQRSQVRDEPEDEEQCGCASYAVSELSSKKRNQSSEVRSSILAVVQGHQLYVDQMIQVLEQLLQGRFPLRPCSILPCALG